MPGSGHDFGQLPGLFSFLQLGLKPDMPSPNGVINRVVQTIEIYERA
jgi:tagatose-6-phosphate ketose/aldose isomerase